MCHCKSPSFSCAALLGGGVGLAVGLDGLDAHLGKVLPVPLQLLVLLFALQVEDQNLVAPALAQHLAGLVCGFNALNLQHVAGRDPILLATGANNRVHNPSSASPARPMRAYRK